MTESPPWPKRWWWVALAIILVVAGAFRYTGYDFSLPYLDHPDEPGYNIGAGLILAVGTAAPEHYDTYPPGIITLNYLLLRWLHSPTELPSTVIPTIRLMSITFSLATICLIALLGYRLATPLAGLLAAGLLAVAPSFIELSRFATADSFVTFFSVLAIFLSLTGTLFNHSRLTTGGILSLILAILFKYQAVFITPLVLLVPLWRLRGADRQSRRAVLQNFVDHCLILGAFFFWLVAIYPALGVIHFNEWFATRLGHPAVPTPETLYRNVMIGLQEPSKVVWILGVLGLGLLFWPNFRHKTWLFGLGVVSGSAVVWLGGLSLFGDQGFKQMLTGSEMAIALCAVGLAGLAEGLAWLFTRIGHPVLAASRGWASGIIVVVLALICSLPQIQDSIANAREHTLHDRRNDLAAWAESTLDPGLYIADRDNHKTFEPFWGGFQGKKHFPHFSMELVTQRTLEEWRNNDVLYAIVPYDVYQQMQTSADGRSYLDQMVLLKSYPPDPQYRGPSMVVFRLYPIQHQNTGSLGPIKLLGYDIDRTEVAPGESFTIRYYWQASQPTDVPYMVFNHLDPLDSFELVAQSDGPPLGESRPTTSWDDSSETILSQPFTITVGENVPPGTYRLIVGFYRLDTGQRLTTPGGDSFLLVTTIQVKGP